MKKNKVTLSSLKKGLGVSAGMRALIKKCVLSALEHERTCRCHISVFLTDDNEIRQINLTHRETNRATDVLSFPFFDLSPGEKPDYSDENIDLDLDLLPLGEMVISFERAEQQAMEYGHSVDRELGFLAVHSTLHLLGYDHERSKEDELIMRKKEEEILGNLGLIR